MMSSTLKLNVQPYVSTSWREEQGQSFPLCGKEF